jgi:hypothetical protein
VPMPTPTETEPPFLAVGLPRPTAVSMPEDDEKPFYLVGLSPPVALLYRLVVCALPLLLVAGIAYLVLILTGAGADRRSRG